MSTIYSAFANPKKDLQEIPDEFIDIFNFLNDDKTKQKVSLKLGRNATVEKITSDIVAGQKDIRLFHFSGHSGGSGMQFSGAEFGSDHIVKFFHTIGADKTRIECMLINGCENAEIVKRLVNVPVVIGTRSKVEDSAARKFTLDFLASLINAKSSYLQAFRDATAAQSNHQLTATEHTRGEGGEETLPEIRNDYFIQVNDASVANRGFPVKKRTNWIKYLFVLFFIIALIIAYSFRIELLKAFRGYTCEPIATASGKCNFVIADFTFPENETGNFHQWLFNAISAADDLKTYLFPINLESFNRVISNNAVHRDSMPRLCDYDFNLTGSYERSGNLYRAKFNIFPFDSETGSDTSIAYTVTSLGNLDTLIAFMKADQANRFILVEMCTACALRKDNPDILPVMRSLINGFQYDSETADAFQQVNFRMAELGLHFKNDTLALNAYASIANAAPNDFALMAIEKTALLNQASGDVKSLYGSQTLLLNELEARKNNPNKYRLNARPEAYQQAADGIKLQRANLILKHHTGALQEYRPQATKDYEDLDHKQYKNRRYTDEIKILRNAGAASGFTPALDQEALINTSPSFGLSDTQAHSQPQETGVSVVVIPFGVTEDRFRQVLKTLKNAEYRINGDKSKILDQPLHQPRAVVLYYDKDLKERAERLAKSMLNWTDIAFRPIYVDPLTLSPSPDKNELTIYWRQ